MLFSTVLMWLLIAVGFVVAVPALWMMAQGLWPALAEKNREAADRGILKSFLLGLIPIIGGIILITFISKLPKMGFLAVLTGGFLIAWGIVGAGGMARLIGERLWPDAEPWRQIKQGGLTLICCALLPVVGWFFILPLLVIIGWGINLRAWFLRQPQPAHTSFPVSAPLPDEAERNAPHA